VLDETGLLTNGRHAAGGARPYRGTAGTVEHGQIGRGLGSAGQLGQAVRARALSRPQAWTTDRARGRQAGIPDARGVEAATGAVGVDQDAVRSWTGW
jgi:SRSO17 transposase